MPRFEAQVWVSGEHPYQVETNAANVFAAKEIIARREGVEEHEVQRVFLINEESSSSSSSFNSQDGGGGDYDLGGIAALCLFILVHGFLEFLAHYSHIGYYWVDLLDL